MTALPATLQPEPAPAPPEYTPPPRAPWIVRMVRSLNPVSLLFGPVFQREMRTTSRRRSTFSIRLIYILLTLGIVIIAYFGSTQRLDYSSGVSRLVALQNIGPEVMRTVLMPQFFILAIIAANLTAPTIGQERRSRTFPVLAVTPITPGQIIGGTLAAKMVQVLLLSLAIVPLLLAIRVFGGLETESIIAVAMVQLSTAIMMGALGLLGSTLSPRGGMAIGLALTVFAVLCLGPLIGMAIWRNWLGFTGMPPMWPMIFSPAICVFVASGVAPIGMGVPTMWVAFGSSAVNLGVALVACFIAARVLRPLILRDAVLDGPPIKARRKKGKVKASPTAPVSSAEGSEPASVTVAGSRASARAAVAQADHADSRIVSDQPVLWRELRRAAFASRKRMVIVCLLLAGLFSLVYFSSDRGPRDDSVAGALVIMLLIGLLFQAAIINAGTIASEVESKSWGILLTTPLSAQHILWSKVLGGMRRLWLLPTLLMLHMVVCVFAGSMHPFLFAIVIPVVLGSLLVMSTTGTLFSLRCARAAAAGANNLGLWLMLWVGTAILGGIASELFDLRNNEWMLGVWLTTNPIGLVALSFDATLRHGELGTFELPGFGQIGAAGYLGVCVGYMLGCALISWLVVQWASLRWRTWSVRRL